MASADGECGAGGGWVEPPAPAADWRAGHDDIDVVARGSLSEQEYYQDYYLQNRPVVVRGAMSGAERCAFSAARWAVEPALDGRRFACGATAYPSLTGRRACG
eukprot:860201-Prymnesium_polylepis.1